MIAKPAAQVLVVEDDAGMARLQEVCLSRAGFAVRVATTADDAMTALCAGNIDLAVLDYQLPGGVTGLDLHARMCEARLDVPVIMVTGFSEESTVVRALRAGVRDFVSKSTEYLDYLPEAARRVLHTTRLERRLAESEARLSSIINSAKDAIITTDAEWTITLFNPAAERMFRCSAADAIGKPFREFVPPSFHNTPAGSRRECDSDSQTLLYQTGSRGIRADGDEFPIEATISRAHVHGERAHIVMIRDVTERRRAESQQAILNAVTRVLAETVSVDVAAERILHIVGEGLECDAAEFWTVDPAGEFLQRNAAWYKPGLAAFAGFLESTRDLKLLRGNETPGLAWLHSRPASHVLNENGSRTARQAALSAAGLCSERAFPLLAGKDVVGVASFLHQRARPTDAHPPTWLAVLGGQVGQYLVRRRTEHRAWEQAQLLENARDAILVEDLDDVVVYWNPSATRLYGWTAEQAVGRNAVELFYAGGNPEVRSEARRVMEQSGEWVGELKQFTKSGAEVLVESRWTLVRDDAGRPKSKLVVNTDITERKKLEAQLRRVQRLESIGTLAGGIAHDLNNILTPITMGVSLLNQRLPDEDRQAVLATLETSAERGAALVQQILTFARGNEGQRAPFSILPLVRELERILRRTFPKSIAISVELPNDLPPVVGDSTQLYQVLMNLCVNARDALPHGGNLTLAVEETKLDEQSCRAFHQGRAGRYVQFRVVDSGCGISRENIDKIFDPFFTTKEVGTGLGLATVLNIVKAHGGFINVCSELNRGTQFAVYLPTAETPDVVDHDSSAEIPPGESELILVVDDEHSIRQLMQTTLEACGYRVLTAENGRDAIDLFDRHRPDVQLVVTDLMMPIMDGRATIRVLKQIDPHVRIVAVSGLADDPTVIGDAQHAVRAVLRKPIVTTTLLKTVHQILHESRSPA